MTAAQHLPQQDRDDFLKLIATQLKAPRHRRGRCYATGAQVLRNLEQGGGGL